MRITRKFIMRHNLKKWLAVLCPAVFMTASALPDDTPQAAYITKYASVAVSEMYRSGVPASITLAQGILESRSGLSVLAEEGNNHFGIKCHDWEGRKMYQDDDTEGECFRVYDTPEESFRDHSDFLRYRDRYKSLFDNDITDYKAWAYGLKAAGYATDPAYPQKLIKLIEDYRLYDYDMMIPEDFGISGADEEEPAAPLTRRAARAVRRASKLAARQRVAEIRDSISELRNESRKDTSEAVQTAEIEEKIPASPLSLEEPHRITSGETFTFALKRQTYSLNGVPFIYALEGETYSSVASDYNLFLREILRFNDASQDGDLEPGSVVYLQQKKSAAVKGLDKYISDEGGESMRDLSQRFAVRLKDLCKMNGKSRSYVTVAGDELWLR